MPKSILTTMLALMISAFTLSACGDGGGTTSEEAPATDSDTSG